MDHRKARKLSLTLLIVFLASTAPIACVSSVTPPAAPADPVVVVLKHEARHTGLLLPGPDGDYYEYGYGEQGWYALGEDAWYHVFDTILWPTKGVLGRRLLSSADPDVLASLCPHSRLDRIRVERARAEALEAELARQFQGREPALHVDPACRLEFVPSPDGFWFGHNCHDATADWLRALGCTVSRTPIRGGLEVRVPKDGE